MIQRLKFPGLLALLATALLAACGPADEAGDTVEQEQAETPIDDGTVLGAADLVGLEEENIAFNLPWVPGPITRDPSRPTPPVNEIQRVSTMQNATYDRVIFHLGEGEIPGYQISWVRDELPPCTSQGAQSVEAEKRVLVRLTAATATPVARQKLAPDHKNLKELVSSCVREADVEWLLGFQDESQMRVFEMRSPRRLVVDVRHGVR